MQIKWVCNERVMNGEASCILFVISAAQSMTDLSQKAAKPAHLLPTLACCFCAASVRHCTLKVKKSEAARTYSTICLLLPLGHRWLNLKDITAHCLAAGEPPAAWSSRQLISSQMIHRKQCLNKHTVWSLAHLPLEDTSGLAHQPIDGPLLVTFSRPQVPLQIPRLQSNA